MRWPGLSWLDRRAVVLPPGIVPVRMNQDYGPLPDVQRADEPRAVERVIFVCGLHRSGTTLLEGLLHSAFDLTVLRGPVPENEGQHMQDIYPPDFLHGGPGRFAFAAGMRPDVPGVAMARALRREILRCWTPRMAGESAVLLEKSPPNLIRIGWLRAVFPGAGFIVLTRHPVAVSRATLKWVKGGRMPGLMRHWRVAHRAALADWGADCLHLRYEDMCADPAAAMAACGVAFGLTRRERALDLPERFAVTLNTNAAYLAAAGGFDPGPGVWDRLGYGQAE